MKSKSYPQYAIIQEPTASQLTDTLNEFLKEMDEEVDAIEFDGLTARVKYTVTHRYIPEDLSDEYRLAGIQLKCEDCPYFEPMLKTDGTPDRRKKFGACPFTERGVAFRDSAACESLFRAINNREVRLCLAR